MTTRERLHELVAALPEESLRPAESILADLQTWPRALAVPRRRDKAFEQMQRTVRDIEERGHKGSGGGGGVMTVSVDDTVLRSPVRSRHSFSYEDRGDDVSETIVARDGIVVTLIERTRRDDAAARLLYTIEVAGPDGHRTQYEHAYALPR